MPTTAAASAARAARSTNADIDKLTPKQLQAARLRAMGKSVNDICVEIGVTQQTYYRWKKIARFNVAMEELKQEWIEQYEQTFTQMLPRVAERHQQLVNSQSEAIAMRAVDSAHANHIRCVREQDTKTEVEELKEMVRMLCDQLAQQRAGS